MSPLINKLVWAVLMLATYLSILALLWRAVLLNQVTNLSAFWLLLMFVVALVIAGQERRG